MIEGFHVDVTGDELIAILHNRAKAHQERAEAHQKSLDFFKAAGESAGHALASSSMNNAEQAEQNVKRHAAQVRYFIFAAEHISAHDTFRLSHDDLRRLEITDAY